MNNPNIKRRARERESERNKCIIIVTKIETLQFHEITEQAENRIRIVPKQKRRKKEHIEQKYYERIQ